MRRLNFAKIHARNDALAWKAIRTRPRPKEPPRGIDHGGRPADLAELGRAVLMGSEFWSAFESFLRNFYLYRDPSFLAKEPPEFLDRKIQAFLAGTVEFLAEQLDLAIPGWVEKPQYFLEEEWDYVSGLPEFPPELAVRIDNRRRRATAAFRHRNILYEGRNLISV
jgi:hypothetical protein